ncbi:MAG: hypothetical protein Q9208_006629 [Pyrenodesmia sp. 3 TL-2023]
MPLDFSLPASINEAMEQHKQMVEAAAAKAGLSRNPDDGTGKRILQMLNGEDKVEGGKDAGIETKAGDGESSMEGGG